MCQVNRRPALRGVSDDATRAVALASRLPHISLGRGYILRAGAQMATLFRHME